ncbi:MAG: TonB-dependent receptor [Caulobacterales bacterium]
MIFGALGLAALGGYAAPALAQEEIASENAVLDDVVVTARRTEENLQEVPAAVTALSAETIREQNIVEPQQLTGRIPSLFVGNSTTNRTSASYNIRGLGAGFGGADPSVVAYVAEVPTPAAGPGAFYDLQNVQVLKGPQGTLFGRNSIGGAILFEPRRPSSEFSGSVDATVGDYGLRRFEGGVDLPIVSDVLMTRVAFDVYDRDGFTREVSTGADLDDRHYKSGRFSILFRPTDNLENYTIVEYSESDNNGGGLVLSSAKPTAFGGSLATYLQTQNNRGIRYTDHSLALHYDETETRAFTNSTTYNFSDDYLVKMILGYRAYRQHNTNDVDGTPFAIVDYVLSPSGYATGTNGMPSSEQYSGELQLQGSSFGNRFDWIVGVYSDYIEPWPDNSFDAIRQFLAPTPAITVSHKEARSQAAFLSGTLDLSDWLQGVSLTAGARYTYDERTLDSAQFNSPTLIPGAGFGDCPSPSAGVNCSHFNLDFEATTWNLGVNWQVTPDSLLYVATRRGYRGGAFNVNAPLESQKTFRPEFVTDYELGVKTDIDIDDAALRLNVAMFQTNYEDIQYSQTFNGPPGPATYTVIRNGPRATIKGIELESTLALSSGLTLSGFFSHVQGVYDELIISSTVDRSGSKFTGPENRASVTASYDHSIGALGDLQFSGTYIWTDDQTYNGPTSSGTDPTAFQDAYGVLNLRAEWNNFLGSPVELSAFMNNATDEEYKTYYINFYDAAGFSSAMWSEPRMVGVGLRYEFGS